MHFLGHFYALLFKMEEVYIWGKNHFTNKIVRSYRCKENELKTTITTVRATITHFIKSMRGFLVFAFLGISFLPLIIFSLIGFQKMESALRDRITQELERTIQSQTQYINEWLGEKELNIQMLAGNDQIQTMDQDLVKEALKQNFEIQNGFESYIVADLNGNLVFATDNAKVNIKDREYFKKATAGELSVSEPLISRGTGHVIVVIAAPIRNEANRVVGIAAGMLPTNTIIHQLSLLQTGASADSYLVTREGVFFTPSRFEAELKEAGRIKERTELELKADSFGIQQAIQGKTGASIYKNYMGRESFGAYGWIEKGKWGILWEQDTAEALIQVAQLRNSLLLVGLAILLIVIMLAVYFSRKTINPISQISEGIKQLSLGNIALLENESSRIKNNEKIHHLLKRSDELGMAATAFTDLAEYLKNIADTATAISNNDLTKPLQPRSEMDQLGIALAKMMDQLRGIAADIAHNAAVVDDSARNLSTAASQTGQSTEQVATTIQQIARSISQQTESIGNIAQAIDQMGAEIEKVARGAHEQAEAVGAAADVTARINQNIESVESSAVALTRQAEDTTRLSQVGSQRVEETIDGIHNIRAKVGFSAQKVQEMGMRSDQIGAIVETIEDIASQTNLLSLNASIEAARAGEHGKGFAVVADEVRKLAERSGSSTKEIASLIKSIQTTIKEAVDAMEASAFEIANGVEKATAAEEALTSILDSAKDVKQQADNTARVAEKMHQASEELIDAMQAVSRVVHENMFSTQKMTRESQQLNQAIENIASISEENSAAVEEVSASTEELNAQSSEISVAAQSLAGMSQELKSISTQFKL
jgi:methyl-accepting chemotaxis protein